MRNNREWVTSHTHFETIIRRYLLTCSRGFFSGALPNKPIVWIRQRTCDLTTEKWSKSNYHRWQPEWKHKVRFKSQNKRSTSGATMRRFAVSSAAGALLHLRRKPIKSDRIFFSFGSQFHVLGSSSSSGTGGKMTILSCPIKSGTCKSIMAAERIKVDQVRERNMHWSCSKCTPAGHVSSCLFRTLYLQNSVSSELCLLLK